jgi:hypothetical protein
MKLTPGCIIEQSLTCHTFAVRYGGFLSQPSWERKQLRCTSQECPVNVTANEQRMERHNISQKRNRTFQNDFAQVCHHNSTRACMHTNICQKTPCVASTPQITHILDLNHSKPGRITYVRRIRLIMAKLAPHTNATSQKIVKSSTGYTQPHLVKLSSYLLW